MSSQTCSFSWLPPSAIKKLDGIISRNFTVILGDADGVDRLVQDYLNEQNYDNVNVYFAGKTVRNNVRNWNLVNVPSGNLQGRAKFELKDKKMASDADYGMMIWDGKSKGTRNNIKQMLSLGKHFYVIQNDVVYTDRNFIDEKIPIVAAQK